MAKNKHSKPRSVVSNAGGGGAAVLGARGVRGRVIGEVLSGGRNITGVAPRQRSMPRPTRGSARHHLRPEAKPAATPEPAQDDYSDFGFEDTWDSLREASQPRSGGMTGQRQNEFNIFTYAAQAVGVAVGGLGLFFFFAVSYWLFAEDVVREFPFFRVILLPMLLAILCGAKVAANAKRRMRAGVAFPVAVMGTVLGSLVIAAGFYACAWGIGFYPVSVLEDIFDLPYESRDILQVVDEGISQLYMMFREATYVVVPLFGAFLGFAFGRRRA